MKHLHYSQMWVQRWFWRTTARQEIDYIEESDGQIRAYEFKWNPAAKASFSKTFTGNYPMAETRVIHRENFDEFLR